MNNNNKRPSEGDITTTDDLLYYAGKAVRPSSYGDPVELYTKEGPYRNSAVARKMVRFDSGASQQLSRWLTSCWPKPIDPTSAREILKGQPHTAANVLLACQLSDATGRHGFSRVRYAGHIQKDPSPYYDIYDIYSASYDVWIRGVTAGNIRSGNTVPKVADGTITGLENLKRWGFTCHGVVNKSESHWRYSLTCPHGVSGTAQVGNINAGHCPTFCADCSDYVSSQHPGVAAAVLKHATDDPNHQSHATTSWLVVLRATDKTGNTFYKVGKANDIERRYDWADEVLYSKSMTEYCAYKEEQKALGFLQDTGVRLGMSAELFPTAGGGRTETFRSKRGLHLLLAHLKCCL